MTAPAKPYSQACENNKQFILDRIREHFAPGNLVLEIGSGTAQHVTFFAQMMPQVQWQPSDMSANMPTLIAGLDGNGLANIAAPLALDVGQATWPIGDVGGVFTANTLHIMSYASVECFFRSVGEVLQRGSCLCVYGPFKYNNAFTTPSNAQFDLWLKARDPVSGVRDFERVAALAEAQNLELLADHDMPANNQLLVWQMRN